MGTPTSDHPTADLLRVLGVSRSSGALEVRGDAGGTIYLHQGGITFAEAPGTVRPDPDHGTPADLEPVVRASIFEAGLFLLTSSEAPRERPLFRPGRRHWTGDTCRLDVETVLAEVARRQEHLEDLGVPPDAGIHLSGVERGRRLVLTAEQWSVLARHEPGDSARTLARRTGSTLSATVTVLAGLVDDGLCRAVSPPRHRARAAPSLRPAAATPQRRAAGAPTAATTPLPRRVPRIAPLPATLSTTTGPAPALPADPATATDAATTAPVTPVAGPPVGRDAGPGAGAGAGPPAVTVAGPNAGPAAGSAAGAVRPSVAPVTPAAAAPFRPAVAPPSAPSAPTIIDLTSLEAKRALAERVLAGLRRL